MGTHDNGQIKGAAEGGWDWISRFHSLIGVPGLRGGRTRAAGHTRRRGPAAQVPLTALSARSRTAQRQSLKLRRSARGAQPGAYWLTVSCGGVQAFPAPAEERRRAFHGGARKGGARSESNSPHKRLKLPPVIWSRRGRTPSHTPTAVGVHRASSPLAWAASCGQWLISHSRPAANLVNILTIHGILINIMTK